MNCVVYLNYKFNKNLSIWKFYDFMNIMIKSSVYFRLCLFAKEKEYYYSLSIRLIICIIWWFTMKLLVVTDIFFIFIIFSRCMVRAPDDLFYIYVMLKTYFCSYYQLWTLFLITYFLITIRDDKNDFNWVSF